MRDFTFTAAEAREMQLHRDDLMFGLFGKIYAQMQMAAYRGECGAFIEVPAEVTKFAEFDMRIDEMIDKGFTVTNPEINSRGNAVFEVYWET